MLPDRKVTVDSENWLCRFIKAPLPYGRKAWDQTRPPWPEAWRSMRHCCGKPITRRKQRSLRRVPGPSASGRLQRALPIEGKTRRSAALAIPPTIFCRLCVKQQGRIFRDITPKADWSRSNTTTTREWSPRVASPRLCHDFAEALRTGQSQNCPILGWYPL
jgi:hypothetical protein